MIIVVPSCLKDADGARTRSDQYYICSTFNCTTVLIIKYQTSCLNVTLQTLLYRLYRHAQLSAKTIPFPFSIPHIFDPVNEGTSDQVVQILEMRVPINILNFRSRRWGSSLLGLRTPSAQHCALGFSDFSGPFLIVGPVRGQYATQLNIYN